MGTKLTPNQGTEVCALLEKYNEGEWWFDSAGQQFNKLDNGMIAAKSMTTPTALNIILGLFRRMDKEREIVLDMLPHNDPKTPCWHLFHSEIHGVFDGLYPGCAEPLTDGEIRCITGEYKEGVKDFLREDWEGLLRAAVQKVAPRTMESE